MSSCPEEVCCLQQHEEQLSDYKKDLADFRNSLLSLDLEEGDELLVLHATLKKLVLSRSRSYCDPMLTLTSLQLASDSKLPKLDVPTLDGNILKWKCFWEQLCISVHGHSSLPDSEKLIYLQHALKDGSAKHVIDEAVKCLTSRYDCPRLIH